MGAEYREFSVQERDRLRTLAYRVREIAELPEQGQKIRRWKAHNALKSTEPMILIFP